MTPETLDKIIDMTLANFPTNQNIDLISVGKLWTEHFGNKPDDLIETAFHLVLTDAKYWPTVKEIKDAITELTQENYQSRAFKQLESTANKKAAADIFKKINATLKSGKAKEFLANMDIGGIKDYVKNLFPDISDSLIRRNYNELAFAAESAGMCKACMWDVARCETNGYYPVPCLEKEGYVRIEYAPCAKRKRSANR